MEQHIENILQILDGERVACEYISDERVVHALYSDGETEVNCFFLCSFPDNILSYSIWSGLALADKSEEVETNLLKINDKLPSGYFYLDMDSHSIVFYNDFNVYSSFLGETKDNCLEKFCRWSYETFFHIREVLKARNEK